MICIRCGAHVADTNKFCGDCGTPLPWQCIVCGSASPADKRYCGDCGAARGEKAQGPRSLTAGAAVAERRLLTVMFVDLVGSTKLGESLDPEDLRSVIEVFHGTVRGLLTRFDGFIARYMGDGVLVYFGYPQAHEADVERAIRAGLAIVEAVAALATIAGPKGSLKVRIGIDTGLVVAGDLIGSGASLETTVVGNTPNRAARLQGAAEPASVVISDSTRLLVGNLFECRELTLSKQKGFQGTERAWLVLRESEIESRYEALHRGQASLVGREEELGFLLRRWERVKAGEAHVVLLIGEPGVGKSRLVAGLQECLTESPHMCIRVFCSPHYVDAPLHPVTRYLERVAKFQHGDGPAVKWGKLTKALPTSISAEELALLAELVSVRSPDRNVINALRPEQRKARTFATIVRQLCDLSAVKPICLILEDAHWADPSTRELLQQLIEKVPSHRILVIITGRPDLRPIRGDLPYVAVQTLDGFENATAARFVRQIAANVNLSDRVIDRIVAHADGLPLFIEELTKAVLKKVQDNEQSSGPQESVPIEAVPTSLHSSLMARLDRLVKGKEVAQLAAVIGREFSFELMQTISGLPAQQLVDTLAELEQSDIIVAHGGAPFASYSFKHALVQDVAYASLLRERRRTIHLRVAEAIDIDASDDATEPQWIAWHYAEAGDADRSIKYYQRAAENATGRFALAEMVSHLRNGLRQIARLPHSADRDRRELTLQLMLGQALIDLEGGNSDLVREAFERARTLCFSLNDMELLPPVFDGLVANHHYIRANPAKIAEYIAEMKGVYQKTNDQRALLLVTRAECLANFLLGRFEVARQYMETLIKMYDVERDGPQAGMTTRDPRAAMSTFLGICITILGFADAGRNVVQQGVEYARKLNHPVSLNLGLRRACVQGILCKDLPQVAKFAEELATLNETFQTYQGGWEGTFFGDWARLWTQWDPVRFDRVQGFIRHLDAANIRAMLPFYMALAAELAGQNGETAKAAALIERASEIVNSTGSGWCEAEVMRLRARFSISDLDQKILTLRASLVKAREQGAKIWEVRVARDLASLLIEQEKTIEAKAELKPVVEWFKEGKELPDYILAKILLGDLDEART
jgi:class 3 adenylate cyclase